MTPVTVKVEKIHLVRQTAEGSKVRATAFVRIESGTHSSVTGPWRVVAGPAHKPRIYPPSTRMSGSWIECVTLDDEALALVGDAVLEAYARLTQGHAERSA